MSTESRLRWARCDSVTLRIVRGSPLEKLVIVAILSVLRGETAIRRPNFDEFRASSDESDASVNGSSRIASCPTLSSI